MSKKTKYIFITGGVLSSLGKGIASASLGLLLKSRGLTCTILKFDPYINIDPGTMSPYQHGEVYVTDDGAETDLDLGHYERYLDISTTRFNSCSAGQVYHEVIQKERKGQYLGKTVQVIPHITDEIKRRMKIYDKQYDVVLIEIGGTVGDIESLPFLEAVRQICLENGSRNALNIHLTYVPFIRSAGELKTKPTQHSVKVLMEVGIRPDILLCRTEQKIPKDIRNKIALFCNVEEEAVIDALDAETIYEVPNFHAKKNLDDIVISKLGLKTKSLDLDNWTKFVHRIKHPKHTVTIGLVGKYNQVQDSYKSITEAFIHAGAINNTKVNIVWCDSEEISPENIANTMAGLDGILVAPGFGNRGIEGKILAIEYVRKNNIPFFGICLGMQCAVVEFSKNVLNIKDADSTEVDPNTPNPVIDLMDDQKKVTIKGGTMRLGAYDCKLSKNSISYKAYGKSDISERHRHRYEFNNVYLDRMEAAGLMATGKNPETGLVEVVELKDHPYFVGVQYHPELKSTVENPHPLFVSFIKAALQNK